VLLCGGSRPARAEQGKELSDQRHKDNAQQTGDYSLRRNDLSSSAAADLSAPPAAERAWLAPAARWVVVCAVLGLGRLAVASEGELQVTAGPGYTALPGLGEGLDGVGGGLELSYGLSPFWSLSAGSFLAHHFGQTVGEQTFEATRVTSVWIAPRFNLDVFVLIPFVSLGPELLFTDGERHEGQEALDFAVRATLGFDYRPVRRWSLGFEVGWHALLRDPLDYPKWVTTLFRLSYHHDFGAL
jgi:hypothetical protein